MSSSALARHKATTYIAKAAAARKPSDQQVLWEIRHHITEYIQATSMIHTCSQVCFTLVEIQALNRQW